MEITSLTLKKYSDSTSSMLSNNKRLWLKLNFNGFFQNHLKLNYFLTTNMMTTCTKI